MRTGRCHCKKKLIPWSLWAHAAKSSDRADQLLRESFLASKHGKFCPSPDCRGCSLPPESEAESSVSCTECHSLWCFKCHTVDHTPVSCDIARLWMEAVQRVREALPPPPVPVQVPTDSVATVVRSIAEHSFAPCPNCKITIEKSSGCMHS